MTTPPSIKPGDEFLTEENANAILEKNGVLNAPQYFIRKAQTMLNWKMEHQEVATLIASDIKMWASPNLCSKAMPKLPAGYFVANMFPAGYFVANMCPKTMPNMFPEMPFPVAGDACIKKTRPRTVAQSLTWRATAIRTALTTALLALQALLAPLSESPDELSDSETWMRTQMWLLSETHDTRTKERDMAP